MSSEYSNHQILHKRILEIMNDLGIDYFPSANMLRKYDDGVRLIKEIYRSGNFKTIAEEFGLITCTKSHLPRSDSIKNRRFGRLVAIEIVEPELDPLWRCICDCGNEKIIRQYALKSGNVKSCGCIHKEQLVNRNKTVLSKHMLTNHPLYKKWESIKVRCYYPSSNNYKDYGHRGIKMCDEWLDSENGFANFYNWAIKNNWEYGLTIDRINPNGDYEPNNCRWVTNKVQQRNKRNTVFVDYYGKKISMQDICEEKHVPPRTVYQRLRRGLDIYQALGEKEVMRYERTGKI